MVRYHFVYMPLPYPCVTDTWYDFTKDDNTIKFEDVSHSGSIFLENVKRNKLMLTNEVDFDIETVELYIKHWFIAKMIWKALITIMDYSIGQCCDITRITVI
jgi:hypothetical protein